MEASGIVLLISLITAVVRAQQQPDQFDTLRRKLKELQTSQVAPRGDFSEVITNRNINRRDCKTSADCPFDETCQTVCFWLHPESLWIGCKIGCVPTSESILSEILVRKEAGLLDQGSKPPPADDGSIFDGAVEAEAPVHATSTPPSEPSRTANANTPRTEGIAREFAGFGDQLDAQPDRKNRPELLAFVEAPRLTTAHPDLCLPSPVCPLLCGVAIDEDGCLQCNCPEATNQANCTLHRDCADPTQYCSRFEKKCICKPEYTPSQNAPLKCSLRSMGTTGGGSTTLTTSHPTPASTELPFTDAGTVSSNNSIKFSPEVWTPPSTTVGVSTESESGTETTSVFFSTTSKKKFDPSGFWRALMLISGTTSAPVQDQTPGTGDLTSRCTTAADCQSGLSCCQKSFCDEKNSCGTGKFCLYKCSVE